MSLHMVLTQFAIYLVRLFFKGSFEDGGDTCELQTHSKSHA